MPKSRGCGSGLILDSSPEKIRIRILPLYRPDPDPEPNMLEPGSEYKLLQKLNPSKTAGPISTALLKALQSSGEENKQWPSVYVDFNIVIDALIIVRAVTAFFHYSLF